MRKDRRFKLQFTHNMVWHDHRRSDDSVIKYGTVAQARNAARRMGLMGCTARWRIVSPSGQMWPVWER